MSFERIEFDYFDLKVYRTNDGFTKESREVESWEAGKMIKERRESNENS